MVLWHAGALLLLLQGAVKGQDPNNAAVTYTGHQGAMMVGNDLGTGNYTTANAKGHCSSLSQCVGFTWCVATVAVLRGRLFHCVLVFGAIGTLGTLGTLGCFAGSLCLPIACVKPQTF